MIRYPAGIKNERYTIPSTVTTIGEVSFGGCNYLTSVTIPSSVNSIEDESFYLCSNLSSAYFYGNAPGMGDSIFDGVKSNFTVYYKAGQTGFTNPWNGYPTAIFGGPYKVNISYINGSVTGLQPQYNHGDIVTLTAVPNNGYIFVNWSDKTGKILCTTEKYSFQITYNTDIIAKFTDQCDVDKNGEVTISDLAKTARNYNTKNSNPNWDPAYDFNKDGVVDIYDLVTISKKIK